MTDFFTNLWNSVNLTSTTWSFEESFLSCLTELWSITCIIITCFQRLGSPIIRWHMLISEWSILRRDESFFSILWTLYFCSFIILEPSLNIHKIFSFIPISVKYLSKIISIDINIIVHRNLRISISLWSTNRSRIWLSFICLTTADIWCSIWRKVRLFTWKCFFNKFFPLQRSLSQFFPSFLNISQKFFNISSSWILFSLLFSYRLLPSHFWWKVSIVPFK